MHLSVRSKAEILTPAATSREEEQHFIWRMMVNSLLSQDRAGIYFCLQQEQKVVMCVCVCIFLTVPNSSKNDALKTYQGVYF